MSLSSVLLVACLLCCQAIRGYEEDYEVTYDDSYYNEIPLEEQQEAGPTVTPCQAQEASRWDKLFIMMEDSQMRQNMLLHSLDAVVRAELRALAGDLRRVAGGNTATWTEAVEAMGDRLMGQLGKKVERVVREARVERAARQDVVLQQLLETGQNQVAQLAKMEGTCLTRLGRGAGLGAGLHQQEAASGVGTAEVVRLETVLATMAADLQRVQAQLDVSQRRADQNFLPSGCDLALLFPLRSQFIHAMVTADAPMSQSLTVCLWAKPAQVLNRTVLFSYSTRENPQEVQLSLSGGAVLFTVAGQAELVEARGVVREGQWGHYCGAWSSEQGLAFLWVNGQQVASSPVVAQGHVLPAQGSMFLGQEWKGSYSGIHPSFNPKLGFTGKITGFNVWDRVLSPEEISQHAQLDGSCGQTGNVVGWGVSHITPRKGAEYLT